MTLASSQISPKQEHQIPGLLHLLHRQKQILEKKTGRPANITMALVEYQAVLLSRCRRTKRKEVSTSPFPFRLCVTAIHAQAGV